MVNVVEKNKILIHVPSTFTHLTLDAEWSRDWYVPQNMAIMHTVTDSLRFCNVKLCVSVKFYSRQ